MMSYYFHPREKKYGHKLELMKFSNAMTCAKKSEQNYRDLVAHEFKIQT